MRVRLHGACEECHEAAGGLATVCRVTAVSPPYPDRRGGGLVHVYLDVRLPDQHDQHNDTRDGSEGSPS